MPNPFERALLVVATACWALALVHFGGLVSFADRMALSLYGFFSTAVATGWLFGNVYAHRRRRLPPPLKRRALLLYYLGPPGMLYLLRALAPAAEQLAAPFVPFFALGVYTVFFLVPLTITWVPGGRPGEDADRES